MAFRAIGSTLFRASRAQLARPAVPSAARFNAPLTSANLRFRLFAAEAGYLDEGVVTSRVLEVVKKFEKVRCFVLFCAIGLSEADERAIDIHG